MSATIFGRNGTVWDGSKGAFFWTLDTVAEAIHDKDLGRQLHERSEAGVHWLDLEEFSPEGHDDILEILHAAADLGRARLPESAGREALIAQLDDLRNLE
ncbi:hypothetical protein Cch01nite_32280 [Cellulomonas chitinilytica]|uniref:Uncharacterized protein n=1 Tax=Cellulomonas chitinilytica TaxID=398759 RepID=A0A919P719_9CELL|nr:hypothetical protein Cch01nite_32280 [Cellulomonas chitinilytica]